MEILGLIFLLVNVVFFLWFISSINKINNNLTQLQLIMNCVVSNTNTNKKSVVVKNKNTGRWVGKNNEFTEMAESAIKFESKAHAQLWLHQNNLSLSEYSISPVE